MATMLNPNAIQNGSITQDKIASGQVTEPKLDADLTTKVNNNVKVVEQVLTDAEIDIASKNLKFRDANGNFFADRKSYDAVAKLSIVPKFSMFGNNCFSNTFGEHCSYNTFGNSFWGNTFGSFCEDNTFGVYCNSNIFSNDCSNNIFGSNCSNNIFGSNLQYSKIDNAVIYIELKSNATSTSPLKNIHILSGVRGKSSTERLVINIPDEYLNSSRELIITTKRMDGGPSTPKDIVMYYADEVVYKQNKQDNTLATTSKEVVGAINELFNGGVKDKSIEVGKLAQAVQDTLKMVGTNVKILPKGTDLLSDNIEEGVHILLPTGSGTYPNFPYSMNLHPGATAILVKAGDSSIILGVDMSSSDELPLLLKRRNGGNWYGTSITNKFNSKLNASAGSVKTTNLANGAVSLDKLASSIQNTLGKVGMNVKEVKSGEDLFSLEDGIYSLNGSTYTNYPIGIPFNASSVCILVVTHSNQRATLYGVDGSHSSPILPLVAIGDLTNKRWTGGSFYSFFASDYEVGHKLDLKLDNTSTLTDTEVNNIWDNN